MAPLLKRQFMYQYLVRVSKLIYFDEFHHYFPYN